MKLKTKIFTPETPRSRENSEMQIRTVFVANVKLAQRICVPLSRKRGRAGEGERTRREKISYSGVAIRHVR